jgi:DNA polymerase I-like protein with 3'-5' exonuclease and polymerase domains
MKLNFQTLSGFEWQPPQTFPDLSSAKEIAIDLETYDPRMETKGPGWPTSDGYIVGFAIATEGFKGYYPVRHEGGGNLDDRRVRKYIHDILATPADKIFFNAAYDVGWLQAEGFKVQGRILDAMIAAALIDENRFSFSLNALGFDCLGEIKSEEGLKRAAAEFGLHPKRDLWRLPAMYVGEYAEQDAELTLKLYQWQKIEMVKQELSSIFDLETRLFPILLEMTRRGVRFDSKKAEKVLGSMQLRERDLETQIRLLVGQGVDIWAAASIAKAFDKLGLPYGKTEKGAPSFTKEFLAGHPHPIAKLIVEARELNKASGTFVQKLGDFASRSGRIHAHINQIRSDDGGTVSGRFSYNNPNLQQIPARNPEIGPLLRGLFLPEEGQQWASLDFSQQEPRLAVHYACVAVDRGLPGAMEAARAYREDPNTDFHQTVADMAKISRKQAKTIGLGLMYGMGKGKMANELGLMPEEAAQLISQFHDNVPFLKSLVNAVQTRINNPNSHGSIRTLLGRRCRFPLWEPVAFGIFKGLPREQAEAEYGLPLRRSYTYKGLNRLIQGSAADQTKQAMVSVYEQTGRIPLVQVHDELAFSVDTRDEALEIKQIMETCVKLEVPSLVDLEIGPSWGEAK